MAFYTRKSEVDQTVKSVMMPRSSSYGNPLWGDNRPKNVPFGASGPMNRSPGRGTGGIGASVRPAKEVSMTVEQTLMPRSARK